MKSHAVIVGSLIVSVLASTSSAIAGDKSMVCRGEMGNGYLATQPQYKVYDERKFYLTTQCDWLPPNVTKSGPCNYIFDGMRYQGDLFADGGLNLKHLGTFSRVEPNGYLSFKMSDSTNGIGGNEGQRWFRGLCTELTQ